MNDQLKKTYEKIEKTYASATDSSTNPNSSTKSERQRNHRKSGYNIAKTSKLQGVKEDLSTSKGENEKQELFDLIESNLLVQAIDFPTCSKIILVAALYKNCHVHTEKFEAVEKIYNS